MTLRETIAALFRHMRKGRIPRSEIIFYLTLDRRWMSREEAERVIDMAVEQGLIAQEEGGFVPAFDVGEISIPIGFRPSADLFETHDPLREILKRIALATDRPVQEVAAEMNRLIEERFDGRLYPEAAAVILARRYAVPNGDLRDGLDEQVLAAGQE